MTTEKKPEGAQVDVDALKAEAQLRQSYGAKVCPIMSIGVDKFGGSSGLVTGLGERTPGPKEAEVAACVGSACQFFVITAVDAAGRPTSGGCGPAILPSAIMQLQHTLAAALEAMIPKSTAQQS